MPNARASFEPSHHRSVRKLHRSPHTRILFGDEAKAKVLSGAKALADAVRVTLAAKFKAVLIGKKWGTPLVCDDGVTIARGIHLGGPVQDKSGAEPLES